MNYSLRKAELPAERVGTMFTVTEALTLNPFFKLICLDFLPFVFPGDKQTIIRIHVCVECVTISSPDGWRHSPVHLSPPCFQEDPATEKKR